jgi:hypothetical protein
MARYKLLTGVYYARNEGQTNLKADDSHTLHRADDENTRYVESKVDLVAKFANKFELVIPGVNAPITVTEARKREVTLLIQQGTWEEADRGFLETVSDDGFERLKKKFTPASHTKHASLLGDDVTDQFGPAYDNGLKVWRNADGKHNVTKSGGKKPLNREPLESNQVEGWVDEYLKDQ